MRTTTIALAAALGTLAFSAPAAQAQGSGPLLIRAKFGNIPLNDSVTKTGVGSSQKGFEVDFGSKISGGNSFLTVGYFETRKSGQFLRTMPITFTNHGQGPLPFGGLYTTSGIGAYVLSTNGSSNKVRYGGFFGAGLRLGGGLFAEAKYHQVQGDINGLSPNGLAVLVGKQF
jgi:outer membrane protein W